MSDFLKKNGLLYTDDFKTLVGIDTESGEFKGRVPFGPKQISDKAFAGVSYESVSLPDSVKIVGFNLFENAVGVKSIKLPSALSELTPHMFDGCKSLSKVNMPNIVAEFPEFLFNGCASLKEIPFRTDITYIGVGACQGCSSVTSIAFPETVQTIESRAFADCTALESVVIGSNVAEIAEDAFAGCSAINRIRLDETNENFYIGEDGSLYRKSDDKMIIENCPMEKQNVSFFSASDMIGEESSPGDNPANNPVWIDEVDEEEDDDTFSAEIGADIDEQISIGDDVPVDVTASSETVATEEPEGVENSLTNSDNIEVTQNIETQDVQREENMEQNNDVLASIMDQNTSTETVDSSVSVNLDEIAGVVSAMNDTNGVYTEDMAKAKKQEKNVTILCNSVEYSYIKDFEPAGVPVVNPTLYVIAEKLVTTSSGNTTVSDKLMSCCEALVKIHNFRRVIFFSGLPLDNDEFVMFLTNMLNLQNVLIACEASSPANLSDYCKQVCEIAGVSLEKTEMAEQQKRASVNEPGVIKLIVQDKY